MIAATPWGQPQVTQDAQTDGPGVFDFILAILAGAVAVALLSLWSFPIPHPSAWTEISVGAGLRPPENVFPSFVRILMSAIFAICHLHGETAMLAMQWTARVFTGFTVALVYLFFSDVLRLMMRGVRDNPIWRRRVTRLIVFTVTLLFAFSDPVWRAGQTFSPDTLLLFLTLSLLTLFFRFICTGRLHFFYGCIFTCGLMSAESPAGFILSMFILVASFVAIRRLSDISLPFYNPLVMQFSRWKMSFFLFLGVVLALTLNIVSFCIMGGMEASGWDVGDMIIKSVVHYGLVAAGAASIVGWCLMLVFAILPLVVAVVLFKGATDEDNFLPYRSGIVYMLVGVLAYTQLSAHRALWFWAWSEETDLMPSVYLRCLCLLMVALAGMLSIVVLGVTFYLRNNHRIMRQRFPELLESQFEMARIASNRRTVRMVRRFGGVFLAAAFLAVVIPGRRQNALREMMCALRDYVNETVAEAGDSRWIFTDGHFDDALELRSVAEGGALKAVNMMAGQSDFDKAMRLRGISKDVQEEENRKCLENGAVDALRTWVCDREPGSVKFAVQVGSEFWKRGKLVAPPVSGTLVRYGMAKEAADAGTAAAKSIAERILDLRKSGKGGGFFDIKVNRLADVILFRISRMARLHAEEQDRAGRPQKASNDVEFSDRLDRANESLVRLLDTVRRKVRESGPQLTPREGLKLALNRADFALASRYAIPILNGDPDDVEANFGMGMNFLLEKQYARAVEHLSRVLLRKPKEPAVLNNLAICHLNLNNLDEAETNAVKALAELPKSAEIRETLDLIKKARQDAAKASAALGSDSAAPAKPPPGKE